MRRAGLCAIAAAALAWIALAGEAPDERFHRGERGAALAATTDVLRALLRDDAAGASEALDRIVASSPRLPPEARDVFGGDIVALDGSLHITLDRSREAAGAGDTETAWQEFRWVVTTCRRCHGFARTAGRLPAEGPLW